MDKIHQIILNILVTKDLDEKFFEHVDPWDETLASIVWAIRASYDRTKMATPGQVVFGIYIIFNLASVVEWQAITAAKQLQVDIDNVR